MRKLIAYSIILIMVISVNAMDVSAKALNHTNIRDKIVYAEDFNAEVTNTVPENVSITGGNVHVVERVPHKDKAVYLEIKDGAASIEGNLENEVAYVGLSFDVRLNKPRSGLTVSLKKDNSSLKLLKIDSDGTANLHNGYRVSGIKSNSYSNVSILYSGKSKNYNVYIDDQLVISDWKIKSGSLAFVSGFKIDFSYDGESKPNEVPCAYVDNIYMYESRKFIPSEQIAKSGYNPSMVEYLPQIKHEKSSNIYLANDFDNSSSGVKPMPFDNICEVYEDKEEDNKYLKVERIGSEGVIFDIKAQPNENKFVFEMDLKYKKNTHPFILYMRGNVGSAGLIKISNGAVVSAVENTTLAKLSSAAWTRIALVYNINKASFDFYKNGELVRKNIPTDMKNESVSDFRFYGPSGSGSADLMVDNILIYDGEEPSAEFSSSMPKPVAVTNYEAEVLGYVKDSMVLSDHSDYGFYCGKRNFLSEPVYKENGQTMISADLFKEAYGASIEYDETNGDIRIGSSTKFKVGETLGETVGKSITLKSAPCIKEGKLYLGIEDIASTVYGKKVIYDDHGLTIVVNADKKFTDSQLTKISNYMIYDHPTANQLIEIFEQNKPQHPRILATKETFDDVKANWQKNENKKRWGTSVLQEADVCCKNTDDVVKYYFPPGDGTLLTICRSVYKKAKILGMAYWLTGDKKYVDRLWLDIEAAANFPDWYPPHPLDVSEMSMGFAISYDWCYDAWTDEQKKIMEDAMFKHGIKPYYSAQYGGKMSWTIIEKNNRGIVNNAGAAAAAMAVFEKDPELCSQLISNTIWGMDNPLECFYPVGAWPEGTMYWGYAHDYLTNYLSTVLSVFGTDFNMLKAIGFDKSAEFAMYTMGINTSDNFHDSEPYAKSYSSCVYWLADHLNDQNSVNIMLSKAPEVGGPQGLIWYNPKEDETGFHAENDKFFEGDDQYFSMRSSWTDVSATILNGHAGQGEGGHSHLDTGTFILDMIGERWACDLGKDDYTIKGLDNKDTRYLYYRLSPQGHNCLVINPGNNDTFYDMNSFCPMYRKEFKEKGGYIIYNMSPAQVGRATEAKRGFRLDDHRRSAVVRDEVSLTKANSDVYWFMQTQADVEIENDNSVILSIGSKKVRIRFITNASEIEITSGGAKPLEGTSDFAEQKDNEALGYKRLSVKMKASGDMYIQAKFTPVGDISDESENENIPLESWTAPDGKLETLPVVSDISVAGKTIRDFSPTKVSYDYVLDDLNNKPEITVTAGENVVIEKEEVDNTVSFVTRNKDGDLYRRYSIHFKQPEYMPDIEGMTRLPVYEIEASSYSDENGYKDNVSDNNMSTAWTSDGDGEYIMLDLGDPKDIDAVGVAVNSWGEQKRVYTFDIEVSDDCLEWHAVRKGLKNTVFDNSIEVFKFERQNARYIRFVGHCSNVKSFNNVFEFAALQKK